MAALTAISRRSSENDLIAAIKERADLIEEVERHGGQVARRSGDTVTFHCPGPDHYDAHPSFTVRGDRFRCWSQCDRRGDVIDLISWLEGCSTGEAIRRLASRLGIAGNQAKAGRRSDGSLLDEFIRQRQWHPEVVDTLGLFIVRDAYDRPRVRFPFRLNGKVVYHQDRALSPSKRRWLSARGATPCPYEVDRLLQGQDRGHLVICEGVSDVAALVSIYENPAVVGIPGAGGFKEPWAQAFAGLTLWLITDRDQAGEEMRTSLSRMLGEVASVRHVHVPEPFQDVDDWIRGAGPVLFDKACGARTES